MASPVKGLYVRVKVNFKGQCTLLGFPREDPLPVRELISKTCTRMQLSGELSEYALFVAHGRTNIRVFESSDLKDDDECELVLLHMEEDEDDEEMLDSDDDDKTVPMSAEKAKPEPEPEPEVKAPPPPKKRKTDNRKKSAKETQESPPTRSTRQSVASSPPPSPPPRRKVSEKKKSKKKSSSKPRKSKALVAVTKKNKFKLEPGTLLIFDRYSDGHYHEAVVQKYLSPERQLKEPDKCWVFIQNVEQDAPEKKWAKNWIDLNSFKSYVVERDTILGIDDEEDEDDDSFLGTRLSVKWSDGKYYKGTVTKTLSSDTDFVFIDYDDGDQCWSNLGEELDAYEISDPKAGGKKSAAKGRNAKGNDSDSSGDEANERKPRARRSTAVEFSF